MGFLYEMTKDYGVVYNYGITANIIFGIALLLGLAILLYKSHQASRHPSYKEGERIDGTVDSKNK